MPVADAIEHHWLPGTSPPLKHDLWNKTTLVLGSSFNGVASRGMGIDIVKQMSDQTGQLLGGPPRKDLKDEKIFSDESDSMEKLQQMDKDKIKRMEEREEELREKVEKEKHSVEDYESKKEDLQEEAERLLTTRILGPFSGLPMSHAGCMWPVKPYGWWTLHKKTTCLGF